MTTNEAEAGMPAASNGTGEPVIGNGEYLIDALVRAWRQVASEETLEEAKKLPPDWLEQLDHYGNGTPKKPVMRYE